jgi:hypothetical protein
MPTGYCTVTSTYLKDSKNIPVANATIFFEPVDNVGNSFNSLAGGTVPGNTVGSSVSATVLAGAFSLQLADTSLATPPNGGYSVTLVDNVSGHAIPLKGFSCFQPSFALAVACGYSGTQAAWVTAGSPIDFDVVPPNLTAQIAVQIGPTGPQGPAGTASVVTTGSASGNFAVAANLTAKTLFGQLEASQYQTADYNGLAQMILAAGPGAHLELDPQYLGTETPEEWSFLGGRMGWRDYAYALGIIIRDRRPGQDASFAYSLPLGPNFVSPHTFSNHYDNNGSQPANGSSNALFMAFNGANGRDTIGRESSVFGVVETFLAATKSIAQPRLRQVTKTTPGDFGLDYTYANTFGGSRNGDDEGVVGQAIYLAECPGVPSGTIASTDTEGAIQWLRMTPGPNSGYYGNGRHIVQLKTAAGADASYAAYTVTAQNVQPTFTALTVTETVPSGMISAVWGSCAGYTVPGNDDVAQSVSVTIALEGGVSESTGFVTGIAMMSGGARNERVLVTAVAAPSGGSQTITFMAREQPNGGDAGRTNACMFYQDAGGTASGLGQSIGRIGAYDQGLGNPSQSIPILGATGANTIIANTACTGSQNGIPGYYETQPIYAALSLTRVSNVVTVTSTDGTNLQNLQLVQAVITCPSNSSLNATITPTFVGGNYTYPSTGANVSGVVGALVVSGGRNLLKLYRGVEAIRVMDPTQPTDRIGNNIGLEYNDLTWTVGATIEQPSHWAIHINVTNMGITTTQPPANTTCSGTNLYFGGPVANDSLIAQGVYNNQPSTYYQGQGGFAKPPTAWKVTGAWNYLFDLKAAAALLTA